MSVDELIEEGDVDRLIAAALRDEDCWACLRAAEALGKIGDPRAVEPLIVALQDEDPGVRGNAATALGMIGDQRAVDPLIVAIQDEDPGVGKHVANALGMIGDIRTIEPLITALGDADWNVRGNAASALGGIGDKISVEPLITVLGDEEPYVREQAVESLGRIGDPRAVELLIVALQDEDLDLRWHAASALGRIGDKRAVEPLIAALQDENVCVFVASALGRIGDLKAIPALEKAIYDSDKIFGDGAKIFEDEAKEALGKIKSSDAYKEYLKSSAFISSIESDIAKLKSAGARLQEVEELLKQAKAELNKNDFEEANKHAKRCQETVKRIQEENKPEITLKFPEEIFKPNTWKRIEITITNTGLMHAKKIKIEPSGDIEFRPIPTIPQLGKNETKTMTIGMKPTVMGDVPIDIAITFKDALDREYTSSGEMWLLIAESTPMFESISINESSPRQGQSKYKYQVALSFAGEDREYARGLAVLLESRNISFFYDEQEQVDLWGKNLYQHLQSVYRDKAQFCVVFLSHAYAQKLWTRHELESAQARAFRENKEYILPVKIDDTEIPGINETIGYIDLRLVSLEEIANMLVKKLSSQNLED
ncbi:MAG: HEAT repeat-containing taxis proteinF [Candidatus Methanogaster sp.]|nr:MAG: HEAT repeat-containing taxis proteinF [ANME-2 cluster archaeon]